jgi:acyl carrier protein phosphodiesterase
MLLCPDCRGSATEKKDRSGHFVRHYYSCDDLINCGWNSFKFNPPIQEDSVIKPIKPNEIQKIKNSKIPEWIINIVNEMLIEKWDGREARFTLKEVMNAVMAVAPEGMTREHIYNNHWMDFEDLYRQEGWKVEFDKAAYNEDYDDFYRFTK